MGTEVDLFQGKMDELYFTIESSGRMASGPFKDVEKAKTQAAIDVTRGHLCVFVVKTVGRVTKKIQDCQWTESE